MMDEVFSGSIRKLLLWGRISLDNETQKQIKNAISMLKIISQSESEILEGNVIDHDDVFQELEDSLIRQLQE